MNIFKPLSIAAVFLLLGFSIQTFAKTKLIIQSKDDIRQLYLKNTKTGKKDVISTWNKTGGGFLIEVDNMKDVCIETDKTSIFRLFSLEKKQSTKWIEISKGKSISIQECFNKYMGDAASDKDMKKSASEFLVSNYLGNPMYEETTALRGNEDKLTFSDKNSKEFFNNEDIEIKWDTKLKIRHIYIVDITSPNIIWKSDNYPTTTLKFEQIKNEIKKPLETGHQYQINIVLENPHDANMEGEKYAFEFALRPLIFSTKNDPSYFLAKDSINISWRTKYNVKNISLKNVPENKIIWEQQNYTANAVTFEKLKASLKGEINPKVRYQLIIDLEDEKKSSNQYVYNFEVILNDKELKDLMDFINSK
ncbi:MAG: hypothetical protein HY958_09905 [Bacteroidia bacterium]|nr:hypothetical protein [Bacteroidia bacterium]